MCLLSGLGMCSGSSLLLRTRHVGSLSEYTDMPDLRSDSSASGFQKLQLRNRDLYSTSTVTALEREALPDGAWICRKERE